MNEAEVIPSTICDNFPDTVSRMRLVEGFVSWVHIDVADGTFTPNTLWHDPKDLLGFESRLKIELHLMISEVDARIDDWIMSGVSRIIFHLEASRDPQFVLSRIRSAQIKAGLGILIETPWEKTRPFWGISDSILFLAVHPGRPGQTMDPGTVGKISGLREACPKCYLEIDGGVNLDNAKALKEAGANALISTNAIFGSSDIQKAVTDLKNA